MRRTPAKSKAVVTAPRRKFSRAYAAFVESVGDWPLDPAGEGKQPDLVWMQKQFGHGSVWVYIAVDRIANAMGQIEFNFIQPSKPGQYVTTEISGLQRLLDRPNPFQSRFDFVSHYAVSMELTGNAYIELAMPDSQGRPTEMYVLDPSRVQIIPDAKKGAKEYQLTVNGKVVKFQPEEILHIKYPNPLSDVFGLSPLNAAILSIDIDRSAIDWNRTFLKKGGWPTGALKTAAELDKDGFKRLKQQLRQSVNQGAKSAGQFLVLTGGLAFEKIALTPKEVDWLDARRMSRDEILAIYGVPFAVAGLFSTEQTTARSAGVIQQVKNFYLFTVFPKMGKLTAALNRAIIPRFRKDLELVPDLRSVPALQDDVQKQLILAQTFRTLTASGWSPNAALAELYPHVPKFPWGDAAWMNQAMVPITSTDNPFAAQPDAGQNQPPGGQNVPTDPTAGDGQAPPPGKALQIGTMLGFDDLTIAALERFLTRQPETNGAAPL